MDILTKKIKILDKIYNKYDEYVKGINLVCQKGCSDCCTANVVLTSLEAYKIINFIISNGFEDKLKILVNNLPQIRFNYKITINTLAHLCSEKKQIPEEEDNCNSSVCPFLNNNECLIYEARPFGCRCLISLASCKNKGYAEIDDFILTTNNVFLQYIEHIDVNGFTGNIFDLLKFLYEHKNYELYKKGKNLQAQGEKLLVNQPAKIFLIPREYQIQMEPYINYFHFLLSDSE
ncbi:MAG: hypothetical protein HQK76_05320 [Desulfobacterales bacterium]|nr:hypothetical protein [Desulfobacterales bacterium]